MIDKTNKFLLTRLEIDESTKYLVDNNLICSGLSCKNYDIAQVVPYLKDGDLLDLGADGSEILSNAVKLGFKGRKVGIDLAYPMNTEINGIEIFKGDLMQTPFDDNSFDFITCMSVVEHSVSFEKLAKECARLIRKDGQLFISFDYWTPKPDTSKMKLYELDWNVLDKQDVLKLVDELQEVGFVLTSDIDWTTQDAVINPSYCSPVAGVEYTFGILHLIKKYTIVD